MDIIRLEKEGKTVWKNTSGVSGCLRVETQAFSVEQMRNTKETFMAWIKSFDEESLDATIDMVEANIKNGTYVMYKVFSKTPFYVKSDGTPQQKDRRGTDDGTLGEEMDRYSQTLMGSKADAGRLHRTTIVPALEQATKDAVNAPPVTTEA